MITYTIAANPNLKTITNTITNATTNTTTNYKQYQENIASHDISTYKLLNQNTTIHLYQLKI